MSDIFTYTQAKDANEIIYIARSMLGTYSISYKKRGNITNRCLYSYEQLTNEQIAILKELGFTIIDYMDESERERNQHVVKILRKYCQ